jgi:hypothetical protein
MRQTGRMFYTRHGNTEHIRAIKIAMVVLGIRIIQQIQYIHVGIQQRK